MKRFSWMWLAWVCTAIALPAELGAQDAGRPKGRAPSAPSPAGDGGVPNAADAGQAPAPAGDGEKAAEGEAPSETPAEGEEAASTYEPRVEAPSQVREPKTICQGRRIRRVRVRGMQRVTQEDVLASMRLKPGQICTDAEITRDARALWDLGFFDDLTLEGVAIGEKDLVLVVRVKERPSVGKIVYRGNSEIDEDDLKEKVSLKEGEILSIPEVQRQVVKIRDLYAEKGFFLAKVRYELRNMDDHNNEVEVRFIISEGEEVTVRRIRFVGNRNVPSSELNGVMKTSETAFWSFITSSNKFNRDFFEEDLTRLQATYYDRGYLAMQLGTPRVEMTPDRRFIDITIPITEGPRFRIGKLQISEVDGRGRDVPPLTGRKNLMGKVKSKSGEWFSRSKIGESIQDISRVYKDKGYAHVEVNPQTNLQAKTRIVDVNLVIRRGPRVWIERINIRGNSKTQDRVIRREMEIVEGQLYSQTGIEESKARIERLGFFERIDISEEEGSSKSKMVLNIEVAERSTGTFQVGAGFSSIESILLTAQIQQQNLFGRGQSLTLNMQLSGIRQLVQVRFLEPYFLESNWSLGLEAFKTIRQYQDFNRDSTGGGVTLGHPVFDDRLRFFVQYHAEMIKISARTGGLFGQGAGRGFNIFRRIPLANLFQDGLTSSLRFTLTWDSRDNRMIPTNGIFASASTEMAEEFLGSDNVFVRNSLVGRFYKRIWGNIVLKFNHEWGLITSRKPTGVPIFERYFLGGIFNVRGFPLNSIGPRAGIPSTADPNASVVPQGIVIGGNLQGYYNLELEFPIVQSVGIRGVIFTDGGNAWNLEDALCGAPLAGLNDEATDPCRFNPLRIRTSWGFGVRWISPLGPLRFEWGLPFRKRSYEDPIRFEFMIGNSF